MDEETRQRTWMTTEVSLPKKLLFSTGIMFFLILLVFFFNIPNPNMILIAGLVFCSALFGFGGGIIAALIMLGYSLYFFSTDHSFTSFTPENAQKVAVSLIGIAADMIFVCLLKREEIRAFATVDRLTEELHSENRKLQHMSITDALTSLRNRMALRQDFESCLGQTVTVMMIDLNDFKQINDTMGHEEGDRVLKEFGGILSELFGNTRCYRYGGDEFLIIIPEISEEEAREKLDLLRTRLPRTASGPATISVGVSRGHVKDPDTLRKMIAEADERMYQEKRHKQAEPPAEEHVSSGKPTEYTVQEIRSYLDGLAGKYALARVVDPIECRILNLNEDGKISLNESCYGIWNSSRRCINCSSSLACRTGHTHSKDEHFQDKLYHIQSKPVALRLDDGSIFNAVVELVSISDDKAHAANDREEENIGNRTAHYLANHDTLTNVLNANAFYEFSREMIRNNPDRKWLMITSNIMNFRLVNTLFGDMRGNEVLVRTAALLRGIAYRSSGLCGRLGSDQFALLLPCGMYKEEYLLNTEKVLANAFNTGIFTFVIHYGVYEVNDPSIPVSVMCGRANSALRTIREDITRTVAYFNDDIMQKLLREQSVIGGFEKALAENEFKMYLQPLVKRNGEAIGAEALVRWVKEDGTVIMPGDFIETLEHAGLIQKLDVRMWELAVKHLSEWKKETRNLTISVNMSAIDFYSIDVYKALTELIEQYEVDSRMLRLEITETALLVDPDKSNAVVAKLRDRGFLVEIDDFGKGYSSLSLLKNIHADILKIDMNFLQEIQDDNRSSVILSSVISLAESLGMDVIAEGVETTEQLNTLAEMGCQIFQGYYFSKPIPVPVFEEKYIR
ncbi:MAG: EAL domain-containing protein [Solobacterium sp.]|nr:EAL domain-containing protein [Solobacterium sp.]